MPDDYGYTGESIEEDKKKQAKLATLMQAGISKTKAAKALGIAPANVQQFCKNNPEFERKIKEKIEGLASLVAEKFEAALLEDRVKVDTLAVSLGILLDKRSQLVQAEQLRPSLDQPGLSVSDLLNELRSLPAQNVAIQVNIGQDRPALDVPTQTEQTGGGG